MSIFNIKTSCYKRFNSSMGLPIRISRGCPLIPIKYNLKYALPALFQPKELLRNFTLTEERFSEEYTLHLNGVGLDRIKIALELIAAKSKSKTLVLLCFEENKLDCHRGIFADWWLSQTGEEIEEV